jgi:hypothetical protein
MYIDVKIGDEFIVENRIGKGIYFVSKVTSKRFEVGGYTFDKKNGNQIGASSSYYKSFVRKATKDEKKEIIENIKYRKLILSFKNIDFKEFSLNQLIEIEELIKKLRLQK